MYRQRLLLKNRDSISCSEWDFVFVHRAYQQRVRYAMHTNSQRIQRRGNIEWKICRIILQLRKRKAYYLSDVGRKVTSFFLFLCGKSIKSLHFNRHGSHVPFRKIAFKFAHVMCISHFHKFNNHFSHNIFNVHPDVRYMGNKPRKYYLLPS